MPAVTVWLAGSALTVKSGVGAGTALNATLCAIQSPRLLNTAVARQLPGTDVIRCSALSPFGAVRLKILKPAPGLQRLRYLGG